MDYVRRVAMGLLGLFLVVVTLGVFSKAQLGYYPLAAALLAMAFIWVAHIGKGRIPNWRFLTGAGVGVALLVFWAVESFMESVFETLAVVSVAGVLGGLMLGGGLLLLVAALLGPKAERFGLSVGRFRQDREVS
jgi:hypothetical protein